MKKVDYLNLYKDVLIENSEGHLNNEDFSQINKTLTVGQLKKMLENVDDNIPVLVDNDSDAQYFQQVPIRGGYESGESSEITNKESKYFLLSSVFNESCEEWFKENEPSWIEDENESA